MTKFLDKLKKLLKSADGESSRVDQPSPATKSLPGITRAYQGTQGRSSPPSLGQHNQQLPLTSGPNVLEDSSVSCPNALGSASARVTPSNSRAVSGYLGAPGVKSNMSTPRSSCLRQSLDAATCTHAVKAAEAEHGEKHRRTRSIGRNSAALHGTVKLDSPSITHGLDPALCAKIKDMVFVEVPVFVDQNDSNPEQHLQQQQQQQQQKEQAADSKQNSKDLVAVMKRAFGASPNGAKPHSDQVHSKVQRMRSLPMMLDTSLQHHAALQAQAQAEGRMPQSKQSREAQGAPSAEGEPKRPGDAWAQVERSLLPSNRHTSLKALLHLDNYDFFSDVNVADAQDAMAASEPRNSGTSRLGSFSAQQGRGGLGQDMQPQSESNILAVSEVLPRGMCRAMWGLNDYIVIKKLHQGYASNVYFARCQFTQELVVLKVYRLSDQGDLERVQLYREIRVHSKLQHQNIVQFYAAFLEKNCVIIVQEYAAGGDLLRFMYKCGGRLPERQAVNLVLQPFLSALLHLHSQGIIHRDIKPENCLLTDTRVLKLADFGLAVDLREERANTRAGTLEYMAPEILKCPTKKTPDQFKQTPGGQHYEMGADAWAVGTFAYELIVGTPPFKAPGGEMIDTARNIIAVNLTYPSSISEMARSFISACLRKHSGDRPTVVEMLQHPWIRMFQRRSSVHMPGEVAQSPLSSLDLQNQVAMGGARGIGVSPVASGASYRPIGGLGASPSTSMGAGASGRLARLSPPHPAHHHHHHHHHLHHLAHQQQQ